jgi:hypothetical protein
MEATQQDIEDRLAKKPQYVQAALGAVDPKIMALGAGAGLLFGGPIGIGFVSGAAILTAINATVSVIQEHGETGQRISPVTQTKNDKINWGLNGAVVGGLVAATLPFSISVVPVAVASGFFMDYVGKALISQEQRELSAAQTLIENDRVNNAVNAAALGFNNDNSDIVGTGQFTSANRSRKHGGNVTFQQQFLEQQAKEAELAKYATVS